MPSPYPSVPAGQDAQDCLNPWDFRVRVLDPDSARRPKAAQALTGDDWLNQRFFAMEMNN